MGLCKLTKEDYQAVYKIMAEAFPIEEIRSYENGLKQLENTDYRILGSKNFEHKIDGFIAEWNLEMAYFVEHFAIERSKRGLGIGSRMMEAYLRQSAKPVIIEVEDDKSERGKSRVEFYRRRGFNLSNYGYEQPIVRGDKNKRIPLRLMSYPHPLAQEEFGKFKDRVFTMIYRTDKSYW